MLTQNTLLACEGKKVLFCRRKNQFVTAGVLGK